MFGPQRIAALAGACALALVGCGGGSGSSDATTVVEAGEPAPVDARDNTFRPEDISVAPGTEVVWTNKGRTDHDVQPVDDDDWGVAPDAFGPDATYTHTFAEPGRYAVLPHAPRHQDQRDDRRCDRA